MPAAPVCSRASAHAGQPASAAGGAAPRPPVSARFPIARPRGCDSAPLPCPVDFRRTSSTADHLGPSPPSVAPAQPPRGRSENGPCALSNEVGVGSSRASGAWSRPGRIEALATAVRSGSRTGWTWPRTGISRSRSSRIVPPPSRPRPGGGAAGARPAGEDPRPRRRDRRTGATGRAAQGGGRGGSRPPAPEGDGGHVRHRPRRRRLR